MAEAADRIHLKNQSLPNRETRAQEPPMVLPGIESEPIPQDKQPKPGTTPLPTRISSQSTKGKSLLRYADEQAAKSQKHRDKERYWEDEGIHIPSQFTAIEAADDKLYTHQIRIPRAYTDAIRSPQAYA